MTPDWVINYSKYQRAMATAKNSNDISEVKALYISFGGKVIITDDEPTIELEPEVIADVKAKKVKKTK